MKILYITQYFYPEIGATTNRALANVRYLANKGHEITILTEMPNHPRGIIFKGYRRKIFKTEKMENFTVNRIWVFTRPKKTFITRILFYTSFLFLATFHATLNWKKYDLVYLTSPPLFVGSIGLNLKKIFHKTKLIVEIRDLWPDAAIEMGELNNRMYANFSYRLEKRIYKYADHIIAVTERFKERIVNKDVPSHKISVVRNGSDLSFKKVQVPQSLMSKYNVDNNFVIVYAGNLGLAQNLQFVLDTAQILVNTNILFLLIGTGPKEVELKEYVKENKILNVEFIGEIAKENISEYLSLADCGIIPLKNIKVFEGTIPSKLFDYMSANLPILLGVKGEAAEILTDSEAGITYEPDNAQDLADKIVYLQNNPKEMEKMSTKGRIFIERNFNRKNLAKKLEKIILTEMVNTK